MMSIETSLTIISIVLVLWVVIAIYTLLQIGRTLKKLNEALNTINSYLPSIIANIEETVIRINNTAKDASLKVESLLIGASALKSAFSISANEQKTGLFGTVLTVAGGFATLKAAWKGIAAFLSEYRAKK